MEREPAAQAALANPHDHPEDMRMSHAKFRADPLKAVAVHSEQRRTHTDSVIYIYKIRRRRTRRFLNVL